MKLFVIAAALIVAGESFDDIINIIYNMRTLRSRVYRYPGEKYCFKIFVSQNFICCTRSIFIYLYITEIPYFENVIVDFDCVM